jgi:hypothetical protein
MAAAPTEVTYMTTRVVELSELTLVHEIFTRAQGMSSTRRGVVVTGSPTFIRAL